MKIYFAGPLFSEAEKKFNFKLTKKLERLEFEVYLPQRDGVEKNRPPYNTMQPDERRKALFELDKKQILGSEIFLFVLDGRVPDEGACVELGIAYAQRDLLKLKKHLVGFMTDQRAAFVGSKLNPMLKVPLDFIAEDEKSLLEYLSELKK